MSLFKKEYKDTEGFLYRASGRWQMGVFSKKAKCGYNPWFSFKKKSSSYQKIIEFL